MSEDSNEVWAAVVLFDMGNGKIGTVLAAGRSEAEAMGAALMSAPEGRAVFGKASLLCATISGEAPA